MLKSNDTVKTIRPLKVTIVNGESLGCMTLVPGEYRVEECVSPEPELAIHNGYVDLIVPALNLLVTASFDDFEDACYNESDWERDNAHILNHPDNPDNKE